MGLSVVPPETNREDILDESGTWLPYTSIGCLRDDLPGHLRLSHDVEVANRVNLGFEDGNGKCQGSDKEVEIRI